MKTEQRLGIGFRESGIIAGPEKSVCMATKKYVLVEPGDEKAPQLAKKIKAELFGKCSKIEQDVLRKMSADEIAKAIPFGSRKMV